MKIYAPKYYSDFSCIADRCRHSCCIGWEIDIDSETLEKYRSLKADYADEIRKSIDDAKVPHFRLGIGERCPHLSENGLCRIITQLSEDFLCDICREHPRFYNINERGMFVGLGMACEEAARIIFSSDGYGVFIETGETDGENEKIGFDSYVPIQNIYSVLFASDMPYRDKLEKIYGEFEMSPSCISDEEWREILSSLEYLNEEHRDVFFRYSSDLCTPEYAEKALERALAYFVYRHCTGARDENSFFVSLGFCLFCERLLATAIKVNNAVGFEDICTLGRIISEEIEYSEDNTEEIKLAFLF